MPQALWLMVIPLGATPIIYLLRRTWVGALLAAAVASYSAWLAVNLPAGVVLNLLGRTFTLDALSQAILALLFAAAAILFLTLTILSLGNIKDNYAVHYVKSIGQEVRIFYPAALIILGIFVAASFTRHLGITAILIELAAILAVFVIQTERLESTRASLRFLTLMSLAMPFFLLAAWLIDVNQLTGETDTLEQIALFVGLGFALWLAVMPFHGWLTSTATEASPPMAAFVLITFPAIGLLTFIHLLIDAPWLFDSNYLVTAMLLAGVITAFAGGVMAGVQRGFSELLGYSALYNLGCLVALLALGGKAAIITIVVALTARSLALVLIAAGTSTLHLQAPGDGFAQIKGFAWHMPVAAAGLLAGGLTLAGAPLTIGFAPYWQLLQSMASIDSRGVWLLIFGGLGVSIGYLRGFRALVSTERQTTQRTVQVFTFQEPAALIVIISVLGLLGLLLGIFPSLLIEPLQAATLNIPFPIR